MVEIPEVPSAIPGNRAETVARTLLEAWHLEELYGGLIEGQEELDVTTTAALWNQMFLESFSDQSLDDLIEGAEAQVRQIMDDHSLYKPGMSPFNMFSGHQRHEMRNYAVRDKHGIYGREYETDSHEAITAYLRMGKLVELIAWNETLEEVKVRAYAEERRKRFEFQDDDLRIAEEEGRAADAAADEALGNM